MKTPFCKSIYDPPWFFVELSHSAEKWIQQMSSLFLSSQGLQCSSKRNEEISIQVSHSKNYNFVYWLSWSNVLKHITLIVYLIIHWLTLNICLKCLKCKLDFAFLLQDFFNKGNFQTNKYSAMCTKKEVSQVLDRILKLIWLQSFSENHR